MSDKDKAPEIRIIKTDNNLKIKGGVSKNTEAPGKLPDASIQRADLVIQEMCKDCQDVVGGHIEAVREIWSKILVDPQGANREELNQEMFTLAHEIKDITSMCGYSLNAHFAESLRDYVAKTELQFDAQRVIIQAHMDAMMAVHKQDLKEDGGPLADELKKIVKVAIEKYS